MLDYCQHYGLRLTKLFEDSAISGGAVAGRDQFEAMTELAKRADEPLVSAILYWDTKRFARNQLDSQFYKADLRRRGYKLVSISDDIPDNEFSIVFEAFLEWKAEKDRQDIAKDTRRGLQFIVGLKDDQGHYIGLAPGKPPTCFIGQSYDTGLKRNNGKPRITQRWVPDPATWDKGKLAWKLRSERASYKEIEAATGLFSGTINPASSYQGFFANEIYIGRFRYGGHLYENFVPAMATMEQWEAVQKLAYQRPTKGEKFPTGKIHPYTGRGDFLLSGLCECMYCGSTLHASQNRQYARGREWPAYTCALKKARPGECEAKQIPAHRLEFAVLQFVNTRVLTSDFVEALVTDVNRLLDDTGPVEQQLETQRSKIATLRQAVNNLLDLAEIHGSQAVVERLAQRENELKSAQWEMERLTRQLQQAKISVSPGLIVTLLSDMKLTLLGKEVKARQKILRQCVEKIEVGRTRARLYYKFPLVSLVEDWYMPSTGHLLIFNAEIII